MPNTKALDEHYSALSDEELLKLAVGGGLTEQAEQVLGKELARRNLTLDQESDTLLLNGLIKQPWAQSAFSCLRTASGLPERSPG